MRHSLTLRNGYLLVRRKIFNRAWCCCLLLCCLQSYAADPSLDWKTHESEHFLIHYPQSLKGFVAKVEYLAEHSHESLSPYFHWQPQQKTQVILLDEVDQANGFASPIPNNAMTLYMQAPTEGELLVYDDWLKMLIHHEYTHVLHVDKVLATPAWLRTLFGRNLLLFPNALHPNWFQEGLATYMETEDATGVGRGQSNDFQMMMRQEVMAGIKPLSRINSVNGHDWPFNTAYLYGVYFFRFINDVYGAQAINELINNYSDNLLPYRVNSNPILVTGKRLEQLWPDFQNYLNGYFLPQIERIAGQPTSEERVVAAGHLAYGTVAKGVDHDYWYSASDGNHGVNLYHYEQGTEHRVLPLNSLASVDVNEDGRVLISQLEHCGQYAKYYDLYVLKQGELTRLSHCGRYRLAKWVNQQRILALHYEGGEGVLQVLDDSGQVLETLWRGQPDHVMSSFDVSDSGEIVASIKFSQQPWNLYLWQEGRWRALTADAARQTHPEFLGEDVYFIQSQLGQSEIYKVAANGDNRVRLSHSLGGYRQLVANADGNALALSYGAEGYQLVTVKLKPHADLPIEKFAALSPLPSFNVNFDSDPEYNPLPSLMPTYWFPVYLAQGSLSEVGFFTSGQDALANHQYVLQLTHESQHKQILVDANYIYDGRWIFGLQQDLSNSTAHNISEYRSQWFAAYMHPLLAVADSLYPYVAYTHSHTELRFTDTATFSGIEEDDNWLALGLIYDGLSSSLNASGASKGWQFGASIESAEAAHNSYYTGQVVSLNSRHYQTLNAGGTIAQRLFLGLGFASNSPFKLGGERSDAYVGPGIRLKQRQYPLRGYNEGQGELEGENALLYNLEYGLPFSWSDHNMMAPPLGFAGWSLRAFSDHAMVWDEGEHMGKVYSSLGLEAILDTSVFYNVALRFRVGVAKGLDALGTDAVYVQLGGAF